MTNINIKHFDTLNQTPVWFDLTFSVFYIATGEVVVPEIPWIWVNNKVDLCLGLTDSPAYCLENPILDSLH